MSRASAEDLTKALCLVAVGGGVGAVVRYLLTETLVGAAYPVPWPTLTVNTVGCLLMGVLMTLTGRMELHRQPVHLLLGTGFLGGFTTFSHLLDSVRQLLRDGAPALSLFYTVLGVVLGIVAVWLGTLIARTQRKVG